MSRRLSRQEEDARVVLGLLGVANAIAIVGFIVEYGWIWIALKFIGLAGLLAAVFGLLYFALVAVEYLADDEDLTS